MEVEYGNVTFRVRKMLPKEAKRLLLVHIRPLLGGLANTDVSKDASTWSMLLSAFVNAPLEHYDSIVAQLYKNIDYRKSGSGWMQLYGDDDAAFADIDMAYILALEAKAFCLNFQESFSVAKSELFPEAMAFLNGKLQT